ncbi:UvrD-helicase domain-containing protein [Xanthobacter variabilis]|uniref:UvrD-helicase domain-containing protein n=1 Tax=Xanthobacter variabilis TaxID=3119932 RepID=UPI0037274283
MTPELRIVPAGAGAGKTHHIQTQLLDWVKSGQVRPERILAVTFTEAGAAELRQRIRASLVAAGHMEGALAVERAYVSTIHGLGLRLVTEHAFAAGASPAPRLISDAERDLLIRQALAHADALEDISGDLKRHGYAAGWGGGSAEEAFRARVLEMVTLLGHLGPRGLDPALAGEAEAAIRAIHGAVEPDGGSLAARLHAAVTALLATFPDSLAGLATSATARDAFRSDHRALCDARGRTRLDQDWALWARLGALRQSKRGSATPDGYDVLAQAVMDAAAALESHPGPLDDACQHLRALVGGAQQILSRYGARKRELGVIDFADMVADAARLLRERPEVRNAVLDEIDCVIVDEFQDTNPIQFDLVWSLARHAPRTILVGDMKQAIMGFQGADARLMGAIAGVFADQVKPLDRNWRSDPRIMAFVNDLGAGLFPEAYDPLAPTRAQSSGSALEVVVTEAPRRGRSEVRPPHHLAAHIAAMLARADTRITDRHTGEARALRPGDIAVLCPTNTQCAAYADTLRALGLPVQVNRNGWWSSAIVQAACHALEVADDPQDLHAALCFLVLGPPRVPLEAALRQLIDTEDLTHPALDSLHALAEDAPRRTVRALLGEVIAAARLRDFCEVQEEPGEARADLIRLEAEADAFLATHRDMRAAAGFHGSGAKVFLGWLASQIGERGFNRHADPTGRKAEGIEVVTWHASKGREWPVVAVAGLDHGFDPRTGALSSVCSDFSDLDRLIERTRLHFSPAFAAPAVADRFFAAQAPQAEATARRLAYVALTRARDTLVLEWPAAAVQKTLIQPDEPCFSAAALLATRCHMSVEAGAIAIGGKRHSARVSFCGKTIPPEFDTPRPVPVPTLPRLGRRAVAPCAARADAGPARLVPSQLPASLVAAPDKLETQLLDAAEWRPGERSWTSAAACGTALHEALRLLLTRPDLAPRLPSHLGLVPEDAQILAGRAQALRAWLAARGYARITTEVPMEATLAGGAQLSATLDLLAEGEAGLAIIDHKSDADRDFEAGFRRHWPQLSAYVAGLRALDPRRGPVLVAIHWVTAGMISFAELQGSAPDAAVEPLDNCLETVRPPR